MTIRTGGNIIAGGFTEELLQTKANLNLDNSTAITNCITSIPQDIKLELNDSTLILKAGSKVYVPNGSGVFNSYILQQDITSVSANEYIFFLNPSKTGLAGGQIKHCFSGTEAPQNPFTGYFWWDNTTNQIKRYNGSSWIGGFSLPIGLVNSLGKLQVFNGIGFIGYSLFAVPDLSVLIPNGRDEKNNLKNTKYTVKSIVEYHRVNSYTSNDLYILLHENEIGVADHYVVATDEPNLNYVSWYNPNTNFIYYKGDGYHNIIDKGAVIGTYNRETGQITSLQMRNCFHALDYNDSSTISGWSMPSSRYIDLTLGASGATYTAPANGWVFFAKASSSSGQFNSITNSTAGGLRSDCDASDSNQWATVNCPVKKGDGFSVEYTTAGETKRFRFIYAEGESNV